MLTEKSSFYEKEIFAIYSYQTYKNRFYYQAFLFKALNDLGVVSKMPWLNGGGVSSMVAMSNKLYFNEHIKMGIKKGKLIILGDMSYISLYKTYQNRHIIKNTIIKKYNLPHNKIIIVNLANWLEQNLADEKTHFDIIDKTISPLLKYQDTYNILISLHPRKIISDYKFLEKKFNITIIDERLMDVLPISDIYIADQSSTIVWSILCGIKTLSVCYYKRMDIFTEFKSLVSADKEDELEEQIDNLFSNDISFTFDWELLSKDLVFNDNIVNNYVNALNKIIK